MINEKIFFGDKKLLSEGQNFSLNYYLTKICGNNKLIYGIAIEKLHNDFILEREVVSNVSDNYSTVREIITKMIKYAVTPMTMIDILDDIIDDADDMNVLSRAC
ncbi:MAG: hypothetical protein A2Y24_08810 [Clostridiales bacterium GWE2_32_10]|nr:MAG: hypothetical protein A2Y24_08810 [Clostridiales bacterium GWE2_32_10]